jgi:hypothetical protein
MVRTGVQRRDLGGQPQAQAGRHGHREPSRGRRNPGAPWLGSDRMSR